MSAAASLPSRRLPPVVQVMPAGSNVPAIQPAAKVVALRSRDPWREASERARQIAVAREDVVLEVQARIRPGVSTDQAIRSLQAAAAAGAVGALLTQSLALVSKGGKPAPTRSVLYEWLKSYNTEGRTGLLPDHKGRVVEAASWWGPALEYFNAPSKPDISAVHRRLAEVDGFAVSYDQVRAYLNSVPAMVGRNSPARLGKNLYRLTEKAFVRRSTAHALPGDVYVADGYRADVYLAHPVSGDIWRPELTVAIDLRSRVVVGWRADEHEGAYAVQNMWAECFARWGHVPPMLYIDNGSGYKNRLMDDAVTGFYARAGVQQIIHSIPGNPHGKGWVERFFRIVKDDFLKLWRPEFYCGDDIAAEVSNRTVRECKAGRLTPPSLREFGEAFNVWLDRYAHRPHPEDKTVTRAQVWSGLSPIAPAANVCELKRQQVSLQVRRASIQHGKRAYGHADLHAWNGKQVVLEYDLMDDRVAVIRDEAGRWICDAHLIRAIDVIAPNRLEEKRIARVEDATRRLEKKIAEQQARAGLLIDAEAVATAAAPALEGEARLLPDHNHPDHPDTHPGDDTPLVLDLTDFD